MRSRQLLVTVVAIFVATPGFSGAAASAAPQGASSAPQLKDDSYRSIISRYSSKCVDVAGWSSADEANVHQWECKGQSNQRWRFREISPGIYNIIAEHSGKLLDVDTRNSNGDYGGNVHQYRDWGGRNQQWYLQDASDGYVYIKSRHNDKCLDVDTRPGNVDGANIHNWTCWGGNNQLWKIS